MTKLVFKVRGENIYSTYKFPLKLRPEDDELLSSWLVRLSLLHRTMPMTFTNLYMPETRNQFWVADIDLQGDPVLLSAVSAKSGVLPETLHAMTLKSYEGFLVENVYGKTRATKFVNPLALRGRRSTLPGLRYCPLCLREDERQYYRKKWRLAFSVVCTKHHCFLNDRCPKCSTPLTPYLACKAGRLDVCYKCGRVLGNTTISEPDSEKIVTVVENLYKILDDGYVMRAEVPVYSHLYFSVLHQILRLMLSRHYGLRMREAVGIDSLEVTGCKTFELVPIRDQARMLIKAAWLLEDWPHRFIAICGRQKLFSSSLLKDLEDAPFWYWRVVMEKLYYPDKVITVEEILKATEFMEKRGMPVSELSLSKMLGVRQVFRKRSVKMGNDFRHIPYEVL